MVLTNKGININLKVVNLRHQRQKCPCNGVKHQLPPDLWCLTLILRNRKDFSQCASSSQGICLLAAVTMSSLLGKVRFLSLKCEKFALAAEGSQRSSESLGMVSNPRLAWPAQA